jgi:hypothetical protein
MTGSTAPWYIEQFFGPDGKPLSGGKVFFWVAGSTVIPKAIYSDIALTTPLSQPLVLDAGGFAPEYFLEPGLYKIQTFNSTMTGGAQHTRDNVQGSTTGGGSGADDHLVIANLTDPIPGALVDKARSSQSVTITVVDVGGRKLQFDVDEDWLASWLTINYPFPADDHLVISDGTAQTAGTLSQKITDALGTVFAVNGAKQLVIPLYEIKGDASDSTPGFLDAKIESTSTVSLSVDPTSHKLRATYVGATDDHLVLASDTDTAPGALRTKLQPGSGMRLDSTVDPILGEVISISMIRIPTPIAIPVNRIVLGSGSGVMSDALLTYLNKQLLVAAASIETFYLGLGSYAGFSNAEVRTVPARNFKDGVTQYADGTIRIGADGDGYAIKLDPVTKEIWFAADTTIIPLGKMIDPGVEISAATYALPVVAAGETRTVRFNGAAGCTITADAAQIPRYRSTSTGLSVVGAAGGQVDATAVFGVVAGCKVAAITIKGISATVCQVQY